MAIVGRLYITFWIVHEHKAIGNSILVLSQATAASPWGKKVNGLKRGYIVVLKGTKWLVTKAQRSRSTGKLVRSNTIYHPTLEGTGHIGIVLRVSPKHIEIAQQNCTLSWKGIRSAQMATMIIPITDKTHYEAAEHGEYFFYKLEEMGQWYRYKPLAMDGGGRPSSPTAKAKQAIRND